MLKAEASLLTAYICVHLKGEHDRMHEDKLNLEPNCQYGTTDVWEIIFLRAFLGRPEYHPHLCYEVADTGFNGINNVSLVIFSWC